MAIPFVKEFDDLAENIAEPPPNRPIAKAVGNFGRNVCDAVSNNPGLYAPTILQFPITAVCTPYWDSQGYSAPVEQSPFQGGQCSGVIYRFRADVWNPITNQFDSGVTQGGAQESLPGPITSIQVIEGAACFTGFTGGRLVQIVAQSSFGGGSTLTFNQSCIADTNGGAVGLRNLQPFRGDGLPDDCGSPDPVLVPGPTPAPNPGPLPPGTGPRFDIRGNPIFVLPPTLEISPGVTVELSPGEINLGSGTGGAPAQPPLPGEDTPGTGSGAGGGDTDFGEPPDGERWAGCCVTITASPVGAGSIPQAEPQSIYPTTVGNVRLKFAIAAGGSEYDTPIVNRQKTTCVWEPVRGLNPTGVRVNLLPDYSYAIQPFSVPEEQ